MTLPDVDRDPAFGLPSALGLPLCLRPIRFGSASASELLIGGACRLYGWSVWESTGLATARIRLWSPSTTGQLVAIIQLNQYESRADFFTPHWLAVSNLYKESVTGSVDGVVYVIPE